MSAWTGPLRTETSLSIWQQLKEAAVPVATYWLATLFGLLAFSASILITEPSFGADDFIILGGFWVLTCLGVAAGQVLAFLRVRTWVLLLTGAVLWTIFFVFIATAMSTGMPEWLGGLLFAIFFLGPIAMTGGLWSLETHRALWSTWLPMIYAVGGVIAWTENTGNVDRWFAGQKWAIWDLVSFGILGITLVLIIAYLVTRETHRLALWKRGPMAPLQPSLQETGRARPRLTLGGAAVLITLAGMLAFGTALVAPYLWRTGPRDEGDRPVPGQMEESEPEPDQGESEFWKRVEQMAQQAAQAAKEASGVMCGGLTAFMLLTLLAMGTWRPMKRLVVLRHLREPFWKVPATGRIEQGWRMVEIALGDVGLHPHPGEDAAGLAARAAPLLKELSPVEVHGLEDAAAVADRVRFGLGVGPEDEAVMARFSRWVIDTVWERLDDWAQLKAMYRSL